MFAVLVHVGTSCLYVTGGPRTRSSCQQGSASTTRTARPPGNTSGATTSRVAGSLLPRQRALTIACSAGWCVYTDLRGWLPQALIDKAIPKMLMDFVTHLNVHVSKEKREGNWQWQVLYNSRGDQKPGGWIPKAVCVNPNRCHSTRPHPAHPSRHPLRLWGSGTTPRALWEPQLQLTPATRGAGAGGGARGAIAPLPNFLSQWDGYAPVPPPKIWQSL